MIKRGQQILSHKEFYFDVINYKSFFSKTIHVIEGNVRNKIRLVGLAARDKIVICERISSLCSLGDFMKSLPDS